MELVISYLKENDSINLDDHFDPIYTFSKDFKDNYELLKFLFNTNNC